MANRKLLLVSKIGEIFMYKKFFLLFIVFIFSLSPIISETVILENTGFCMNMGETQVLVEVKNLQLIKNATKDKDGKTIEPEQIIYTANSDNPYMKLVLICDWYEKQDYKDLTWTDQTSLFIIKYLQVENTQLNFENHEYTIKYDSINVLDYSDFRDEWAQYGKNVTKSEVQKIYNPAFDKIVKR